METIFLVVRISFEAWTSVSMSLKHRHWSFEARMSVCMSFEVQTSVPMSSHYIGIAVTHLCQNIQTVILIPRWSVSAIGNPTLYNF